MTIEVWEVEVKHSGDSMIHEYYLVKASKPSTAEKKALSIIRKNPDFKLNFGVPYIAATQHKGYVHL